MCYPSHVKENVGTEMLYSPLALSYLARHTPEHYDISLYDEYVGEDLDPDTINADIVAVSSLSSGITRAFEIGDRLRKRGIKTVIGGAHVTSLPEEALEHFDTVILGEGETPWKQFLADYENGGTKDKYFGAMNVCLENIGTPRRDLIHENYHYPSVMTSRGCPYACSFCYLTVYKNRKYRTIPHETVLEDFDLVKDNALVIVTDENFIGYSEKDIYDRKSLMNKMIQRKYGFVWGCQASINIAEQPELMKLMYKAGCRGVFVGFESTDPESLKSISKNHNIGIDYKKAIRKIHDQKIAVIASCILGMDNQNNGYHKHLIRELKNIKADFVRVFYMTAWPGTQLHKQLEAEGRTTTDWDSLRKDIPTTQFKHYTHDEALAARKEIMDSFFKWPNLIKVLSRWVFKDISLIGVFVKMSFRNKRSERIRNNRAKSTLQKNMDFVKSNGSSLMAERASKKELA